MVNLLTVCLSHVALHGTVRCPPGGRAGVVLSEEQKQLVEFLHKVSRSMQRLVDSSCEEFGGKLVTLEQSLWSIHNEFIELGRVPYASSSNPHRHRDSCRFNAQEQS